VKSFVDIGTTRQSIHQQAIGGAAVMSRRLLVGLTLTSLMFAGTAAKAADAPSIEIGLISSLSGPIGDQGSDWANGARLAAEAINKDGGVAALGHRPIHLDVADDTSVPSVTRTLAIKLISNEKVPLILGPFASGPCMAAAPIGEQQQRTLICSAASDQPTQ
jgi:branched-chain amino acid transport system substrate-binding protein